MSAETNIITTRPAFGAAGEVRYVEGEKPQPRTDLDISGVTFGGLVAFVGSRKDIILGLKNESSFLVDEANTTIDLMVREYGGHTDETDHRKYLPAVELHAAAIPSKDYAEVKAIMAKSWPSTHDLAMHLRKFPHLFPSIEVFKTVVNKLRNVTVIIKNIAAQSSSDSGDRSVTFDQKVENAPNLECTWSFRVAMFEGEKAIELPVQMLYNANQSLSGVDSTVYSHDRELVERKAREEMMTRTVKDLRTILSGTVAEGETAPVDPVPFVYVSKGGK